MQNTFDDDALNDQPITFSITVSAGKFYVDGVLQDDLNLEAGNTYVFDYSSVAAHPLSLSTTPDGIHGGGSNYADGVTDLGNNQLQIEVTENTPDLYYFCQNHPGMGGSARVVPDVVAIAENSVVGSSVGITAYAEDLDAGDSVSYSLSDDAGGLFAIAAETGVVTLSGELDYEAATSHDITVLATSSDGSSSSKTFNISVTDDVSDNDTTIGQTPDTEPPVLNSLASNPITGAGQYFGASPLKDGGFVAAYENPE